MRLEAKVGNDNGVEELKKIAGVRDVTASDDGDWKNFSLRVESGADVREEIFRLASERRWSVRELSQRTRYTRRCFRRDHASGRSLSPGEMSTTKPTAYGYA